MPPPLTAPIRDSRQPELAAAIRACRAAFVAIAVFSAAINVLMLTSAVYMLQLFDRVLLSRSVDTLLLLTLIAGVALATLSALDLIRGRVLVAVSEWLDARLGGLLLEAGIVTGLDSRSVPSVRTLRDLNTWRLYLTGPSLFPILDAPWTPIFLAVIYFLDPLLGAVALSGAVVLFALAVLNDLLTRVPLQEAGEASARAMQAAEGAARNADVIDAMGMREAVRSQWAQSNQRAMQLQAIASRRGGAVSAVSKFVRQALQVGMFGVGARLVINIEATPGVMVAGAILLGRALAPVEQAIGGWRSALNARQAYLRIRSRLGEIPAEAESLPLPEPEGRLSVEAVTYFHPGDENPVLRKVTFSVEPGEALALIGPSGAGKTTLARILMGNVTAQSGHARLDGVDIARWDSADRGRYVGYLPQHVGLLSGSVHSNIARMRSGTPEAVFEAAGLAGVHDLIVHLPQAYETEVGEGGAALSGGERQRVALARAVYGNPRFVLLDEPNANLDQVGEEALLATLAELRARGTTVVIIALRSSILRHVDKVLVLPRRRGAGVRLSR